MWARFKAALTPISDAVMKIQPPRWSGLPTCHCRLPRCLKLRLNFRLSCAASTLRLPIVCLDAVTPTEHSETTQCHTVGPVMLIRRDHPQPPAAQSCQLFSAAPDLLRLQPNLLAVANSLMILFTNGQFTVFAWNIVFLALSHNQWWQSASHFACRTLRKHVFEIA